MLVVCVVREIGAFLLKAVFAKRVVGTRRDSQHVDLPFTHAKRRAGYMCHVPKRVCRRTLAHTSNRSELRIDRGSSQRAVPARKATALTIVRAFSASG
jgi:hypothetical protein